MRTFNKEAKRDGVQGKFHPYGFSHPLCDFSFYKYMDGHRHMPDGSLRNPDNWWGGWDTKVSLDCMARHVLDLELLHSGHYVYKERVDKDTERTHVSLTELKELPANWRVVTEEESCNAIRFNADAYKLQILK